jgi:RNA polymerase sigma-70 factor (ECF subfamily)
MEDNSAPLTPEALHAQRDWVRRVARALVADPNAADDLEQEVWVKALEKKPVVRRSVRAWLGAVLRNAAVDRHRADRRRTTHEAAAAPAEKAVPGPLDLVARAESLQRVGAAVLALREPYRTTLLLRYFEDLTPAEIARRLDVPRETVRTRLHRGLAELRDQLDVGPEGERREWLLLLALPPGAEGAAAPVSAGFGGESGAWSGADQAARESWGTVREVLVMGAKVTFAAGLATGGVAGVLLGLVPRILEPEAPPDSGDPGIHAAAPGDAVARRTGEVVKAEPVREFKQQAPAAAHADGDVDLLVRDENARSAAVKALEETDRRGAEAAARVRQAAVDRLLAAEAQMPTAALMEKLKAITRTPRWERKEPPDVDGGLRLAEKLLAQSLEPEQRAKVLVDKAILHRMQTPPDRDLEEAALREAGGLMSIDTEAGREVIFQRAWTAARGGDDRTAVELFDSLASHPSTQAGIRGTCRWEAATRADKLGDRDNARRWYEEFLRDYGTDEGRWYKDCVARAKERLKEL